MLALTLLLAAPQDSAEAIRAAIVAKCAIPLARLAVEHDPGLDEPGILLKGSAALSDAQFGCYGDQLAGHSVYPVIEDDALSARYTRIVEREARAAARADLRRRGLLARLPRFDRRHETLRHFGRRLEALCHARPGSVLRVKDGHLQLTDSALDPDKPASDAEFCTTNAATAAGHNPLWVPPPPPVEVDLPTTFLPATDNPRR